MESVDPGLESIAGALAPGVLASPPFSEEEFEERVRRVRDRMRERGIGVLLLVGPENIYYLTGLNHQGYFAFTLLVLPLEGTPRVISREMEAATLAAQVPQCEHVAFRDDQDPADVVVAEMDAVVGRLAEGQVVGVEEQTMWFPLDIWNRVLARVPTRLLRDESGLVEECREDRSPAEIACLRRAGAISSRAMEAGLGRVAAGVPQQEVAAAVYATMIAEGSEYPGFVPLIRTRDALLHEHVTWRDKVIEPGDAVFLELSAAVGRYHAPLTRMAYLGQAPPGTERAAAIASAGLQAVLSALVPGTSSGEVYEAWQAVVDEGLGHRRYRRHHCGYLVGIGFPPSWVGGARVVGLREGSSWRVREGMTFHVLSWLLGQEPADYVLSDTVLVTPTGGELLTTTGRDPIVVPL